MSPQFRKAEYCHISAVLPGAVRRRASIGAAKTVVLIVLDSGAEVFTRAALDLVCDYREVLPAFA